LTGGFCLGFVIDKNAQRLEHKKDNKKIGKTAKVIS